MARTDIESCVRMSHKTFKSIYLYNPLRPSSLVIRLKALSVPVYRGFLYLKPKCWDMCWVCNRVLMTHKGLVTHKVANPAPDAADMWTKGVLSHVWSTKSFFSQNSQKDLNCCLQDTRSELISRIYRVEYVHSSDCTYLYAPHFRITWCLKEFWKCMKRKAGSVSWMSYEITKKRHCCKWWEIASNHLLWFRRALNHIWQSVDWSNFWIKIHPRELWFPIHTRWCSLLQDTIWGDQGKKKFALCLTLLYLMPILKFFGKILVPVHLR